VGLSVMILGLVLFFGVHVLTTQRDLRAQLIAMGGETVYKIGYALASAAGLALIGLGFRRLPRLRPDRRLGALALAGDAEDTEAHHGGADVAGGDPGGGVLYPRAHFTTLKHPMLAGVKLWAAAHLLANGDLGSIILFGSFLAWAVFDRISLKRRADPGAPPIPVGGPGNDLIAVAVGIIAYLALAFAFHPVVIGVPVVGA